MPAWFEIEIIDENGLSIGVKLNKEFLKRKTNNLTPCTPNQPWLICEVAGIAPIGMPDAVYLDCRPVTERIEVVRDGLTPHIAQLHFEGRKFNSRVRRCISPWS